MIIQPEDASDARIAQLACDLAEADATELAELSARIIQRWVRDSHDHWVAEDGQRVGYAARGTPLWDPTFDLSCALFAANMVGQTWALIRHRGEPSGYAASFPDVPGFPPPHPQLSPSRALTEAAILAALRLQHLGVRP